MSEKRYFWLKLYDDFFTSKRIKRLRSIAGGDTYTIIYLKMQLKALKTEGFLYFDGVMSDFAEELALDIDEKPEDVKITLDYLKSVGLLEVKADDEYELTFMQNLIGSETAHTQRQRDYIKRKKEREKLEKASQNDASVTQMLQVGDVDIEIEKDIDIDNKENNTKEKRFTPPTLEEVKAYCDERKNSVDPDTFINFYESKGWFVGKNKMKDWKAAVRTWENKNRDNKSNKNQFNNFQQSQYDWDEINRELGIK